MEEREFESRLGDYIEDAVIWIELLMIEEKERTIATEDAMQLE